jgi:hypothetical protein
MWIVIPEDKLGFFDEAAPFFLLFIILQCFDERKRSFEVLNLILVKV